MLLHGAPLFFVSGATVVYEGLAEENITPKAQRDHRSVLHRVRHIDSTRSIEIPRAHFSPLPTRPAIISVASSAA